MRIDEPTTLLTDYALGALSAWLAFRILRSRSSASTIRLWGIGLAALAVAAFAGGSYHGFRHAWPGSLEWLTWRVTALSVGVAGWAFAYASSFHLPVRHAAFFRLLFMAQFVVYALLNTLTDTYLLVVANYAPLMLFVLIVHAMRWSNMASRWIASGIIISLVAALVQALKVTVLAHFNHNDLYHMIQMLGVYCIYRGAALDHERSSSA